MPRKPAPRNAYPELHDGYYCVTMGIPAALRPQLGTRLKRTLGTESLLSANVLKVPVVREFKARIDNAWVNLGGKSRSELHEAVAWANILQDAANRRDPAHGALLQAPHEREAEIASVGSTWKTDGDTYDYEITTPEAREKADTFGAIARRQSTPIALHHDAFIKTLRIKPRSLTDDVRALRIPGRYTSPRHLSFFGLWCSNDEKIPGRTHPHAAACTIMAISSTRYGLDFGNLVTHAKVNGSR